MVTVYGLEFNIGLYKGYDVIGFRVSGSVPNLIQFSFFRSLLDSFVQSLVYILIYFR